MKISVLIAYSGGSAALARALASVNAQSDSDWELHVVGFGPQGDAKAIVHDFAAGRECVHFEHLDNTQLIAVARNRLLELASGDAIAFLQPQDSWVPRHLTHALEAFAAGMDVAVANARCYDPLSQRVLGDAAVPVALRTAAAKTIFAREAIPSASCVVLRRSVAVATGRFDLRFKTQDARDYWFRCALQNARFAPTQRATCRCARPRLVPADRVLAAEQLVQFYEKHRDQAAIPAALRRRLLAGSLVAHGRLLRPVDPARAARSFWRAWSLQPVHVQTLGQFALTGWKYAGAFEPTESRDSEAGVTT